MSDVPLHSGRTTIHSNNAYHDVGEGGDQHLGQQKPSVRDSRATTSVEPMTAVQVVDRLRWWRTYRVREQPIPVDHVVLRGCYANYSSFGTRPLASGVARLLQKARAVREQYLRAQQQQQQQQQQQEEAQHQSRQCSSLLIASTVGTSVRSASSERLHNGAREMERATGCMADGEEGHYGGRQQQQHREMNEKAKEKLDNKRRAAVTSSSLPPPRPLSEDTAAFRGEPAVQRGSSTTHVLCSPLSVSGSVGTFSPFVRAAAGSAQALDTHSCALYVPSEQEARAAERLLMLFRPRAASAPLRSCRHRYAAGHLDVASRELSGESPLQRDRGCKDAAEPHHKRMTCISASDEITDVHRVPGAAEAVIVLHHAPRLILYEKGLNPKAALWASDVSSDAFENLNDAAAESSAEVFALRNLPLCAFERFFYQQQLRGLSETEGSREPVLPSTSPVAVNAGAESAGVPAGDTASAPTGAAATTGISRGDNCVVNGNDTLFFGSPLTTVLACSLKGTVSLLSAAAGAPSCEDGDTSARRVAPYRGSGRGSGRNNRRRGGRAALRAVSVPVLPPVYKGGCPEMGAPASHRHRSSRARLQRQQQQNPSHPSSILPAGLRSGTVSQDVAHLCLRVDDLQDVYVFNPVVDMIGKGAFSKVYAAVPILRGKEGLRRFASPLLSRQVAPCSSAELGGGGPQEGGRSASIARRESSTHEALSSPALRVDSAAGTAVRDTAGPLAEDESRNRRPHEKSLTVSLRSIPVVALKVIPRKARQKPKAPLGSLAAMPSAAAAVTGSATSTVQQAAQNDGDSVRRELVEIEREVSILRRLHHTGCSQFFEAIRTPDAFVIAMRVFPGSMDAQHYISRYGAPSEARAALLLFQLVSTVQYLHTTFGLIHRDIKLENILLSEADASVPDTRIFEVLGEAVHKSDASTIMTMSACGRQGCASTTVAVGTRTAAQHSRSRASHNVTRLLRVTLIDFGLARRTRVNALSPTASASHGRGSVARHGSLNASSTSPTYIASFPPTSATLAAGTAQVHRNTSNSSFSGSLGSPASLSTGGAAGAVMHFNSGNSSSDSYAAVKRAPPRPPLLCRPPSTTVGAGMTHHGPGGTEFGGMECTMSRVGMPSPMPSTANMFTRFLDVEEEMDEEENGGAGGAEEWCTPANPLTRARGFGPSSRQDMAEGEDDSGAFSTGMSASETDDEWEGGSTAEPKEGDTQEREEHSKSWPNKEHGARAALLSPSVLTAQPQTPPGAAVIPPQPVPPTLPLQAGATAVTSSHFNAESSGSCCTTGGAGLRYRCASCIYTSQHQLPPATAADVHSTPDDTEATLLLTPCGTEKYLPPEVLSWILENGWARRSTTVGLARAMDLYAIGIVAYVLLSGCFPFNASSRATLLQQQQRVPRCNSARWAGVSSAAISFVQQLLEPDPRKRMTAKEALEHPFLHEVRQLAEKLSLVPHGEGEEVSHPSTWRDSSQIDNHHRPGSGSPGRYYDDDANVHARWHWAMSTTATTATATGSLLRSVPSPTHADHTCSGAAMELTSAYQNAILSFATNDAQRPPVADQNGLVIVNESSALSSSTGAHHRSAGGSGELAPLHRVEGDTASMAIRLSGSCHLPGVPSVCRSSDECEEDDLLASITRDMLGGVPPLLQACKESLSPTRSLAPATTTTSTPCVATMARAVPIELLASPSLATRPVKLSSFSTPLSPATGAAPSVDGAAAKRATLPEPTSAAAAAASVPALVPSGTYDANVNRNVSPFRAVTTTTAEVVEGGGDDLFESLYNNIMLSD
ncbi:putative Protein kinase domain containing protein [Leishmania utingensis]|uniref:Protein kinase domain-containing protein n=1 Tax=Leishmania utingensis TaxID=653362 RepID=A0AAW3ABC0_9TRYP